MSYLYGQQISKLDFSLKAKPDEVVKQSKRIEDEPTISISTTDQT